MAVIGASTSACDICHDCSKLGVDVTMIQRGPTRIYPPAHIASCQLMVWNDKEGAEVGDNLSSEDPLALQAALSKLVLGELRDSHEYAFQVDFVVFYLFQHGSPEYYEGLRKAGFLAATDGPIHQARLVLLSYILFSILTMSDAQQIYVDAGRHYPDVRRHPLYRNSCAEIIA